MMTKVVDYGSGRYVKMEGLEHRVAAKTGTALQLVRNNEGKLEYSMDDVIASIIGFFPVEDPKVVIGVHIWFPKHGERHGGQLAGPVFEAVGENVVERLRIPRDVEPERRSTRLVSVTESVEKAKTMEECLKDGILPDLSGLTMGEVNRILTSVDLEARFKGTGFAFSQEPEAGTALDGVELCRVEFLVMEQQLMNMTGLPVFHIQEVEPSTHLLATTMALLILARCFPESEGNTASRFATASAIIPARSRSTTISRGRRAAS